MNKSDDQLIDIVLEGGPDELPTRMRVPVDDDTRDRIKLPHWGGHEHFRLVAEPECTEPRVYRWSMRTRIAE